jgi:hypothetical protein
MGRVYALGITLKSIMKVIKSHGFQHRVGELPQPLPVQLRRLPIYCNTIKEAYSFIEIRLDSAARRAVLSANFIIQITQTDGMLRM